MLLKTNSHRPSALLLQQRTLLLLVTVFIQLLWHYYSEKFGKKQAKFEEFR